MEKFAIAPHVSSIAFPMELRRDVIIFKNILGFLWGQEYPELCKLKERWKVTKTSLWVRCIRAFVWSVCGVPLWHACRVDNPTVQEDIVMAKQTEQIHDGSVSCERSNSYLAIIYLSLREYCGIITIFIMPEANNCLSIVSRVLSNSVVNSFVVEPWNNDLCSGP